jgi:hypothetical protein
MTLTITKFSPGYAADTVALWVIIITHALLEAQHTSWLTKAGIRIKAYESFIT